MTTSQCLRVLIGTGFAAGALSLLASEPPIHSLKVLGQAGFNGFGIPTLTVIDPHGETIFTKNEIHYFPGDKNFFSQIVASRGKTRINIGFDPKAGTSAATPLILAEGPQVTGYGTLTYSFEGGVGSAADKEDGSISISQKPPGTGHLSISRSTDGTHVWFSGSFTAKIFHNKQFLMAVSGHFESVPAQ